MQFNILNTNAERSLAHVEEIANITPIQGADRIAMAQILGWRCIIAKEEFNIGDKCIYFEIDSLVNKEDERFAFLEKKNYKVKTMKLGKFNVISQGLAMPLSEFPELGDLPVGTDVTKKLKVTYYNAEDRKRKSAGPDPDAKYKSMAARHKELFRKRPIRWLMRRGWGKKLLFVFFGKKRDNPKRMPGFVKKTDEVRIENCPWLLEDRNTRWYVTEKLDGTSTTFALEKQGKNYDFAVCSRNVRQKDRDQECYHDLNVYWEMADKYNIEEKLLKFAKKYDVNQMYLQGETVGDKVQGNPYNMGVRNFYAFNLVVDGTRYSNPELFGWCDEYEIPHVPHIDRGHELPGNMDDMKVEAEGKSLINPSVLREGLVYRASGDPWLSFKNVSNSFLLKKQKKEEKEECSDSQN